MSGSKRQKIEGAAAPTAAVSKQLIDLLSACQQQEAQLAAPSIVNGSIVINKDVELAVRQAAALLQHAVSELQDAVDAARELAEDQAPVAASEEQSRELIAYAHRLSFTTSAPPGFIPGQTPLLHFKPPAPQDLQLRSSALHQFQREYELKKQGQQRATAYAAPAEVPPAAEEAPPVNLAEIISSLPPMPAGWKPGDPIPGFPAAQALPGSGGAPPVAGALPGEGMPAAAAAVAVTPIPAAKPAAAEPAVPVTATRPLSAAFDFALNPDLEMVFDVGDSDSESGSDSD